MSLAAIRGWPIPKIPAYMGKTMETTEPVTPEMIRAWVAKIAAMSNDPEGAHSEEDVMKDCVLQAIACGVENPKECAAEALKSCDLDFPRWCA